MTTTKLLMLRFYMITLGRWAGFSNLLRRILVRLLIQRSGKKYFASSNFFDWSDFDITP